MKTSKNLSKLLAENGCELTTNCYRRFYMDKDEIVFGDWRGYQGYVPAYDILNDICVKYAKEFWIDGYYGIPKIKCNNSTQHNTFLILKLLQQNKIQEAEDYIWEHCLFNPKNKLNEIKSTNTKKVS